MERKIYIDLHTHTYYSDGIGTPELNVRTARINGIDVMAITDHDKTDGYEEARKMGEKWQVKVIPGVEVSTDKYHILGLGLNIHNPEFVKFLNKSANAQREVCIKRIEFLKSRGVPISLEKVLEVFPKSRLGKMNILYTMAQDKACQTYFLEHGIPILTKESYNDYLRDKKGNWIDDKMTCITSQEAIARIHEAGGIAIIAHPFHDVEDMAEMDLLVQQGLDGLEVQTRGNGENKKFIDFARANNLLITYGSDYHGGVFDRDILSNRGENVLSPELAKALNLEVK